MPAKASTLSRSTLAGWVGRAAFGLLAAGRSGRRHVLAGDKIHGDDTTVPVLAPGTGKTADRAAVGLCPRRPAMGKRGAAGGVLLLQPRPQGRSIRRRISPASAASCRPTAMPASASSTGRAR